MSFGGMMAGVELPAGAAAVTEVATTTTTDAPVAAVRRPRPGWFFNPYVQIALGAVLVTASELLLKKGATAAAGNSWLGVDALASWWTWGGIVTYVLSFASWLYVL